jgi:hypothetical protein
MRKATEQKLARHFLAHRDGGYSVGYVLRKSILRYVILVGLLVLYTIGFIVANELLYKGLWLWGIGMIVGAIAGDVGWLIRIKRQWPFTVTIINWQEVEGIAEGKDTPNQASQSIAAKRGSG